MRLIGLMCKHCEVLSLQVLIGRGLIQEYYVRISLSLHEITQKKICSVLKVLSKSIVGVDGDEVPPVPMPNTEVKLISVKDTWLVTTWENRTMPTQRTEKSFNTFLCSDIPQ